MAAWIALARMLLTLGEPAVQAILALLKAQYPQLS
jgi:hypothetical protein